MTSSLTVAESAEKPFAEENAWRSSTWSPIAMAGLFCVCELREVMIPNGILAREKSLSAETGTHDVRGAIAFVVVKARVEILTWK